MSFSWKNLIRQNIQNLKPYSSARDEYKGKTGTFLDANENPYQTDYNRYPDHEHKKLRTLIAEKKKLPFENMVLGNGSDEIINFLILATCNPGTDNIVSLNPTYGMYKVAADIFGVTYSDVPLNSDYTLNVDELLKRTDSNTKIIFICSPNNPTGNSFSREDIIKIATSTSGLVVVDEAYIDFSDKSFSDLISEYENIAIMQTLSKAYGLAGLRVGILVGHPNLIAAVRKIKAPYNLGSTTQALACAALEKINIQEVVKDLNQLKANLSSDILKLKSTVEIFPSDANFILVKLNKAKNIFDYLIDNQIIVRDRSSVMLCDDCLRISIGTKEENEQLLTFLRKYEENSVH